MAFKIITGQRIKAEEPSDIEVPPQQEMQTQEASPPETPGLFGRLGRSALRGAEAPGQLINMLNMALGEPSLFQQPLLSEKLSEGLTPEQLAGQGPIERFSQKVLEQAPTAALFGPESLAITAASAVPASLAGEAGAPPFVQDLIQFGSSIGAGALRGKFTGIKGAQKKAFDAATSLVDEGTRAEARPIVEALTDVGRKLETEVDINKANKVGGIIDTVKKNISSLFERPNEFTKTIDPIKAMALRRSINSVTRRDPGIFEFTKPLVSGINDFFAQYAAENPAFYSQLKKGDKLTTARNLVPYVNKLIDKLPLPGDIGGLSKGILKGVFGTTAGQIEKFARNIIGNDEARKVFFDLATAASQGNEALVLQNISSLSSTLQQEETIPLPSRSRGRKVKPFKVIRN